MMTTSKITSSNADNPALRRLYETAFPEGEQIRYDDIVAALRAAWVNMPGRRKQ